MAGSASGCASHPPLLTEQWLDYRVTALAMTDLVGVLFDADGESCGFHVGPELFTRVKAVETRIRSGGVVERGILVHDIDHGQIMPLADFIVVGIMPRRDLERTCAKGRIHVTVTDHRNFGG